MKVKLLSSTLAATMLLGGTLSAPAHAADTSAGAPAAQVAQAEGDMASDLAAAEASGTVGDVIQALLTDGLTTDEIAALSDALEALATSDPAAAANVADAIAVEALAIAGESPQAGVDLARIAAGTAANQAVFDADPEAASAALGSASVVADVAEEAGNSAGLTINGIPVVRRIVADAIESYPEYATLIEENIELASAQAALAGFGDTAAGGGPGAGGGTGGGGGLPSTLGNRNPNGLFGGAFRTPAPVTSGGGGGGGGVPVATTDSASPA